MSRRFHRVGALCGSLLVLLVFIGPASAEEVPSDLNSGFEQMYNLDFAGAHDTFQRWEQLHPDDPMGPVSNAAAYLFSEFNRLRILEFDLFTEDEVWVKRPKIAPDPAVKSSF